MNYAIEMGLGALMYTPSFIIVQPVKVSRGGYT
jgi:hypothetical protein